LAAILRQEQIIADHDGCDITIVGPAYDFRHMQDQNAHRDRILKALEQ
jgi:hypothetical protein